MAHRVLSLLLVLLLLSCGKDTIRIKPEKKTLVASVYASALVQPDSLYAVYSSVAGILDKVFVNEGDSVVKGSPLFQIYNKTPELNRENTKINLQDAREAYKGSAAVLEGLREEIHTAKLKLQNDSINFKRQERLWQQEIGSKAEYDIKKLNYELSLNNLNVLQNNYERTKDELRNKVVKAENTYQAAIVSTNEFTITSKINGRVYAIYKNIGEIVTTMEPLASVGSLDDFLIELLVDEVDIVKLKPYQKVIVNLDAYPEEVFEGRVHKIYPKKDERSQTFKVEAVFETAPEVLFPGLAGEANIIVSEKENTLTIPLEYLIDNHTVKTQDGPVNVEIGSKNLTEVEILSGIDEHTDIIKPKQ
ncbi:efflux RND transporter periplasmic adaptor subunit [Maribacter arenosus]|uniref:Efflux RND transporter periplasmic adaptor subunit n=1 Tax=Maribacter arenosus TaxID=1854708 RepID=A0ABR7V7G1_9FLAO|nr:efflux RND transporter periplasmic adaptor subunit [Maribacter arenosus]MBD0849216.1 efflux RND transporter periplasmic adaptor subunit [Maribacter arenosus]